MSQELANIERPSYLAALLAANPSLATVNDDAGSGIGGGLPSTIGFKGTRFVVKENGIETVLNTLELHAIVLKGKPNLEKKWFAAKYVEGQEPTAPDCFSLDGIKPDPSAKLKQCESCAGCANNVFGSGTNAQGEPGKGKACADSKVIAIFANKGIYRFPIPPASLGAWKTHCNQLSAHGVPLPTAITVIGFDADASFPKATFRFGGMLNEQQVNAIIPKIDSPEVAEIIGGGVKLVENKPAAASNVASIDEAKVKKEKEEAEKKEKAKAEKEKKAAEKKAADEAAAAAAAQQGDLGLDLGLGGGEVPAEVVGLGATDDDIIAGLGL